MSFKAMRSSGIFGRYPFPSKYVLPLSYRFQVSRINAIPHPAEMIYSKSCRDRAHKKLVSDSMRQFRASLVVE